MDKEPILCFDGDKAGRRAAYRALDMALPRLMPGNSLRFALLPEGQDPDDLYRSGGREAVAEVLAGARGLADMLWSRETEATAHDTPERRAALEARIKEIIKGIGDETVRRYYSEDFVARLRQLMTPKFDPLGRQASRFGGPAAPRRQSGGRGWQNFSARNRGLGPEPTPPPSARLSGSPIVRGFRSAIPAREALLLVTVVNHPWLLENHAEEFADLELLNPDSDLLRRATLEAGIEQDGGEAASAGALRASLAAKGLGPLLARVEAAITHASDWPVEAATANGDVIRWWTHVITLHHKKRTLNKELKDAEHALGEEPTDANLAWLRDVQARLSALDGSEAQIEGFGALSGRAAGNI